MGANRNGKGRFAPPREKKLADPISLSSSRTLTPVPESLIPPQEWLRSATFAPLGDALLRRWRDGSPEKFSMHWWSGSISSITLNLCVSKHAEDVS